MSDITIYNWMDHFKDVYPSNYYDISELEQNGYMILRNHFSKDYAHELFSLVNSELNKAGNPSRTKTPLVDYMQYKNVAFDQKIIDICTQYYGHIPFLSNINVKRNFASRPQVTETLKFHEDPEAFKLIKVFVYLNDVDINRGPFTYVKGSHRLKIPNNRSKTRWTDKEISDFYGAENIHNLTGEAGDVIIAETSGFHKGLHLKEDSRTMITLYYLADQVRIKPHQAEAKMNTRMWQELPPNLKAVAHFTQRV